MTLVEFLLARIAEDEAERARGRVIPNEVTCPCGQTGTLTRWSFGVEYRAQSVEVTHVVGWNPPTIIGNEITSYGSPITHTHILGDADAIREMNESFELSQEAKRTLAESEAKRRIIELHSAETEYGLGYLANGSYGDISPACRCCGTVDEYAVPWPCTTLKLLALPYADHPDYDESWRP